MRTLSEMMTSFAVQDREPFGIYLQNEGSPADLTLNHGPLLFRGSVNGREHSAHGQASTVFKRNTWHIRRVTLSEIWSKWGVSVLWGPAFMLLGCWRFRKEASHSKMCFEASLHICSCDWPVVSQHGTSGSVCTLASHWQLSRGIIRITGLFAHCKRQVVDIRRIAVKKWTWSWQELEAADINGPVCTVCTTALFWSTSREESPRADAQQP